MLIQRTKNEILISLPKSIKTDELQEVIDFISFKKIVSKSKAKQSEIDKLSKDVKKGWWPQNKKRFINL
jgi:hypothetical protein